MKHVGITITDRGAAIVTVDRSESDNLIVTDIERLPFDLATVAARVRELDPEARYVVDAEGLGSALWAALGHADDDVGRWTLYAGRGLERQALVDELLVAIEQDRFRFGPRLTEQEAISKALLAFRRQVREDGLIGSELVVALLLAIIPPPMPVPEPFILFGKARG